MQQPDNVQISPDDRESEAYLPSVTNGREVGPTPVPTPPPTTQPTPTPRLCLVSGQVVHDEDFDGADPDEARIAGAQVCFGGHCTETDGDGNYSIMLHPGTYDVTVQAGNLHWINDSQVLVTPGIDDLVKTITEDTTLDFLMMEGPLGAPWFLSDQPTFMLNYDRDRREGYMMTWYGETVNQVYDQNNGADFGFPVGTEIVAAVSGKVWKAKYWPGSGTSIVIHTYNALWMLPPEDWMLICAYSHLAEDGIRVKKEEPLKLSIKDFIKCCKTRKKPLSDGKNGLENLKILLKN